MKLFAALLASLSVFSVGPSRADLRDDVRAVAPALERYRESVVIGEVWKRPRLTLRDRSLVTLAALVARNQTIELPYYLNSALDNGVKPSEVSEVITQLAFYAGWGNALAVAPIVKAVFAERKIESSDIAPAWPKPLALNDAAEADREARVAGQFGAMFPGLVQYTTDVLFKDLWLRPDLSPRDRSLTTITALIANGQGAQLGGHINIGMNNGLKQEEIAEAITHLAFYIGWPNAFSAMAVAKETFEKRPR